MELVEGFVKSALKKAFGSVRKGHGDIQRYDRILSHGEQADRSLRIGDLKSAEKHQQIVDRNVRAQRRSDKAYNNYGSSKLGNNVSKQSEQLDESTKPAHLVAGQHYIMHEKGLKDHVLFNGWTDDDEPYSEKVKYKSIKEIPGVKNLKDIEVKHEKHIAEKGVKDGYGRSHRAHLTAIDENGKDDYHFNAYVHNGRLVVGSSATPVLFHPHNADENNGPSKLDESINSVEEAHQYLLDHDKEYADNFRKIMNFHTANTLATFDDFKKGDPEIDKLIRANDDKRKLVFRDNVDRTAKQEDQSLKNSDEYKSASASKGK